MWENPTVFYSMQENVYDAEPLNAEGGSAGRGA
jgi:hypothetical protein